MDISNRYPTCQAMYQALHSSEMETMAVVPPVNKIDLSKGVTPNLPEIVPNFTPNYPISNVNNNPVTQPINNNSYPVNNPQKNNLIPLLITGVLVALGVSGGFLIIQQRAETQARLEEVEREKAEMEIKLAEEQNKRQEEEVKRQESEKLRLEAEQARARAEELRQQAEVKAKSQPQVRTIVVDPSNISNKDNSSSTIGWQPRCGDNWDSYSEWWAVKAPKSALSTVKNNYCGDALVVKGETQVASFKSESAAWSFANSLSTASGYSFWVKKSERR